MFIPPTVLLSPSPSPSAISDSTSTFRDVNRIPLMIYTFITLNLLGSFIFTIVLILTSFTPSRLYCHFRRRRRRHNSTSFTTSAATSSTLLYSTHLPSSDNNTSTSNNSRPNTGAGTTSTPTWRSFCIAYIVFGLSYTIGTLISLGYGHGIEGMDRIAMDEGLPRAACMIQAGLVYAAPALGGNATLALIIQLRSVILFEMGRIKKPMSLFIRRLIVVVPWVLWLINITVILIFTLKNPSLLEMNKFENYSVLVHITFIRGYWYRRLPIHSNV
ncbi:hypothetical protein Agabi119p4_9854 [Agaricus bisporus var. burnettii]|uniref:Uncharacterized protein n=1 Tax=Agaricus bisporus var. burnettii TaxID=192524 RepID=A0A8H7EXE4_AGABI|nr:hypothetical protein Agabi119p4_9854 [Agaricus bisporus var. burnettii]